MPTASRTIVRGSKSPLKGFTGRDYIESKSLLASSLTSDGTDEIQTVTITGTPTGGTFTLTYAGQTTAGIAYNAAADAVETALEALSTIGAANVRVTGGPGPGTPYVVTFVRDLGKQDIALLTASGAGLTGGTSPAVAVTQTLQGVPSNYRGYFLPVGTIMTAVPGDSTKVRKYTGAGGESANTIVGILGRDVELLSNVSPNNDVDVPIWCHSAVFDSTLIIDYATHSAALASAPALKNCQFKA